MSRSRYLLPFAILLALAVTVGSPILISGFLSAQAGRDAIRRGAYGEAAAEFESAASKLPWSPQLWELAGLSAYQAGDDATALRTLQRARNLHVLSATGWEALGSSTWASGAPDLAVKTWQAGTLAHPEAPELWDRLASGYHALRQYDAEQAALVTRLKVHDDAAARYRLALLLIGWDNEGARAALEAAASLDAQVAPAASTLKAAMAVRDTAQGDSARLVVIGRSLGLVDEWPLAARAFQEAARLDAANAEARAWLGEARQHMDEDGRGDLDAAQSLNPNSSVVHTLRGLYWRRKGNLGLSLAEYSRAAELDPGNAGLQSLMGEAFAASGDLVAALEAYERAVDLAPAESSYWRLLAVFSAENEVQVLEVGVAAGQKAVELSPKDPQALDALGWAYAQAGYLVKAEDALLKALDQSPQNATAHLHLGIVYLRWGQNALASQQLDRAVQADPGGGAGEAARKLLQMYYSQ
jgi:tetratricopeptide (TPR) repeat protein